MKESDFEIGKSYLLILRLNSGLLTWIVTCENISPGEVVLSQKTKEFSRGICAILNPSALKLNEDNSIEVTL